VQVQVVSTGRYTTTSLTSKTIAAHSVMSVCSTVCDALGGGRQIAQVLPLAASERDKHHRFYHHKQYRVRIAVLP
jgi:hypothetical protein